jgi:integrase
MVENVGKQFETLKSRVFFGDKDSTAPSDVKFNLTPRTKKIIENFDKEMALANKRIGTRMNYFKCLRTFFFYLGKEKGIKTIGLENLNKEDILDYCQFINDGRMKSGSVNIHKHVIKRIYKFMTGDEEYPRIVKWIKFERKPKHSLPKNLITLEQIKELITCAKNSRDKAIISCLAESGARTSELLNVNIDDLKLIFDEVTKTPIIRMSLEDIKGHTGERNIELFDSIPYLQKWLNEHPYRDNPGSPLFVSLSSATFGKRMGRHSVWELLSTAGKRANLKGVTLNPHSFRHRALTENGKFMSKFELAKFGGHTMSSKMVDVYIHLEDNDINNKLRMARGLSPINSVKQLKSTLKVKRCVCDEINPSTAFFCNRCQRPLDREMKEQFDKERIAKDFLNFIMDTPEASRFMENMMRMFVGKKHMKVENIASLMPKPIG